MTKSMKKAGLTLVLAGAFALSSFAGLAGIKVTKQPSEVTKTVSTAKNLLRAEVRTPLLKDLSAGSELRFRAVASDKLASIVLKGPKDSEESIKTNDEITLVFDVTLPDKGDYTLTLIDKSGGKVVYDIVVN